MAMATLAGWACLIILVTYWFWILAIDPGKVSSWTVPMIITGALGGLGVFLIMMGGSIEPGGSMSGGRRRRY